MRIRHVSIRRFRGIRELDWAVGGDYVCFIGPGDSTKSTVLDATDLALVPRRNIVFNDSDFYKSDTSEAIEIRVTIGDLPDDWMRDSRYGLRLRGWSPSGELHDEPQRGDESVVTVELKVDDSLDPEWAVVVDRDLPFIPLRWKDRESIGCFRLGRFTDWHLSWTRGSVLSRLTDAPGNIGHVLAAASRAACEALAEESFEGLQQGVDKVITSATRFGVTPQEEYVPHLDAKSVSVGAGGITLHDGPVPVRMAGVGTRRLLALGLQMELVKRGGIVLVDEVEHGLEPHRVRHLLRLFRQDLREEGGRGQALLTTHSPVAVAELRADELRVVRSANGTTTIQAVPTDIQNVAIKASEALLSRRVLVCEGATELGLCRGFDSWWGAQNNSSFGLQGVGLVDGGGSSTASVATKVSSLGYSVAYLGDSDVKPDPTPEQMRAAGVSVFLWDDDLCLEQRVVEDLPWEGVVDVVHLAMEYFPEASVRDQIAGRLGEKTESLPQDVGEWQALGEAEVRKAVAESAKSSGKKKRGWFKRVDIAEELAAVLGRYWGAIEAKDLGRKLAALRAWIDEA